MELGLIVLAGGRSSRMGQDKARIKWNGKTFIEETLRKAEAYGFKEKIVVTNTDDEFYRQLPAVVIQDIYPHQGPLSGIHAGLQKSSCTWNFIMSCDMPLFDFFLVDQLQEKIADHYFAVVPSLDGRYQQLAALYRKEYEMVIESMLAAGQQRLRDLFLERPVLKVEMDPWQNLFFNVNTPAEFLLARAKAVNAARKIPLVSITSSQSGTGKTQFICQLLPELKQLGLRVAVVKSDSPGFSLAHEGEPWEFSQAGADGVAVISPAGYAIMQNTPTKENVLAVVEKISGVDLIIIETCSHGLFPVLEIEREGYTRELITDKADLVAVITDRELSQAAASVKKLPLGEPKKTAEFMQKLW